MWTIRKIEGPHTCTTARMSQDYRKLNAKTICNCIIPLVKESPTIPVSTLIVDLQARFKYKVSYRKAWWVKQIAMQQLYGDFDVSYNELQGWPSFTANRWYRWTKPSSTARCQEKQHLTNLGQIEGTTCCDKTFEGFMEVHLLHSTHRIKLLQRV
ncbi:hypothetical protein GOBAR_AA14009 [Gossypium barbadense]|uniref:Uncharacterized protein n=1 Tax=Gossypium barbadense TaxID=3634 RepID=A0A2P5XTH5_GOSBA|nr:hypothetical protein GOBAR_AA14009 [Gossypium barbadense]